MQKLLIEGSTQYSCRIILTQKQTNYLKDWKLKVEVSSQRDLPLFVEEKNIWNVFVIKIWKKDGQSTELLGILIKLFI